MKFFAKLGHLILGILLGVCLVIGGVAAALFASGGVGVVSDMAGNSFNPPEEVKNLSVAGYVTRVLDVASKYQTSTFGQLEDAIGFSITGELAKVIGVDGKVLRDATVDTVFQDVLDGFTITTLQEKLGLEFPDMPIFTDEQFLTKPLTEAFNYLSSSLDFKEMTVKDLDAKFGIKLTGDPFDSEAVQNSKISELGETVQKLALGDFVKIVTSAEVDMYGFEYIVVSGEETADTVKNDWLTSGEYGNLFGILNGVDEPAAYTPGSEGAFQYFADVTVTDGDGNETFHFGKDLRDEWIEDYNAKNPDGKVYSFVDWAKENPEKYELFKENPDRNSDAFWCEEHGIPSNWAPFALPTVVSQETYDANRPVKSNKVLLYLADSTIGEVNKKISEMTLGDVIEIDDGTHFIIRKVENSTLANVGADLTEAVETTQMKDLLGLTTDADVQAWEAKYKTAEEIAEWKEGRTAYDGSDNAFDYFLTVEAQKAWIDANFAETGIQYFDEWEWKTANYGYYEELGELSKIDKGNGGKLFDEWARIIDRKSGTENDTAALTAKYNSEIAEYTDGLTEGTPEYAEAQAKYFAEKYNLYCYDLAKQYCIAKPVLPEEIGENTPDKPVAANGLLLAIGGSTSKTISERMDTLYVADVFADADFSSGLMSMVSPYTTLKNLPTKMTEVMTKSEIIDLLRKDVFMLNDTKWDDLTDEEKARAEAMFGCTINRFLTQVFEGTFVPGTLSGN